MKNDLNLLIVYEIIAGLAVILIFSGIIIIWVKRTAYEI